MRCRNGGRQAPPPGRQREGFEGWKRCSRRLSHYADIGDRELEALAAVKGRIEEFDPGEDLINRGERPAEAFIVTKGWAARNVTQRDGRSQVLNFMLPGDVYDLQVFVAEKADHAITAITAVSVFLSLGRAQAHIKAEAGDRVERFAPYECASRAPLRQSAAFTASRRLAQARLRLMR